MTEQELAELRKRLGLHGWDDPQPGAIWGVPWYGMAEGGGGSPTAFGGGGGGGGGAADAASFGFGAGAGGSYNDGAGGFYSANLANLLQPGGSAGNEGSSPSGEGVGMNATTTSFRDMLGSLVSPVTAMTSVFGQALANGVRGTPERPITSAGLGGLWGAITGDQGPAVTSASALGPQDLGMPGFGDNGATGGGEPSSAGDPTGGEGPAGLAEGGPVTLRNLIGGSPAGDDYGSMMGGAMPYQQGDPTSGMGPAGLGGDLESPSLGGGGMGQGPSGQLNPPGPDDGYAPVDIGENVIPTALVEKMGGQEGVEMLKRMFASGKLTLADIMKAKR